MHVLKVRVERLQVCLGVVDRSCDRTRKLVGEYFVPDIDELDELAEILACLL
jgi:hypothetical protein